MTLSMFLQADQEQASKLLSAYNYNHQNAIEQTALGEFRKASIYHNNAAGFLENLQELKNSKKLADAIIEQIQSEKQMDELRRRLRA